MRPCNGLIQYSLFISLSLFITNCYGHEHPNHVDPVSTKYSQSAITVAPLIKSIETANVQKNDFNQHNEDEHLQDTIEARLQAKHNLRQSVHQHIDDDKHESEEDYINRLNSALEDGYQGEHQFQYPQPPIADAINNTPSQNQTREDVQQPLHIQNETTFSTPTSTQAPSEQQQRTNEKLSSTQTPAEQQQRANEKLSSTQTPPEQQQRANEKLSSTQTPPEQQQRTNEKLLSTQAPSEQQQRTNERLSSMQAPVVVETSKQVPILDERLSSTQAPVVVDTSKQVPILDEKSNSKVVAEEIAPSIPVQANKEQQLKDLKQQTLVEEDIVFIPKETLSTTQSHPQEEAVHAARPIKEHIPPSSDQQQLTSNTLINEAVANNSTLHVKPSSSTPLQTDPPILEVTQTNHPSDSKLEQLKTSETIQNVNSLDVKPNQQQPTFESIETNHLSDVRLEQLKIPDTVQTNSLVDHEPQEPVPETVQNTGSIDPNVSLEQENQQPPVIDTPNPTETIPTNIKTDDTLVVPTKSPTLVQTSAPPTRVLRSATSRIQQNAQTRQRHAQTKSSEPKETLTTETTTASTIEESIEPPSTTILKPEVLLVETFQQSSIDLDINDETETNSTEETIEPEDTIDLPRQVHVHDSTTILNELQKETDEDKTDDLTLDEQIENNATVDSFLVNDHSPHLPRILENEETLSTIDSTIPTITSTLQAIETNTEARILQTDSQIDEASNSVILKSNLSDTISPHQYRQVCWRLPKLFEPSLGLVENQTLRFINLLPEFLQTTLFDRRDTLMNTIWFGSICLMCFLFSLISLYMGVKRLRQSKHEKEIRARCQQLQQYNNQIELERATFERQNQKLSDEIDELKNLPVRDADEEIFELRERYEQVHADWKIARSEHDALQRDIDYKQSLIQRHEFEMQKQVETVAYLNNEILRQKEELGKERETIARVQSNDLSLERFEKLQEIIHELRSEITQLKQDKFAQTDQLQQVQDHTNQLDIDNNELTIKMKQLKELLEQRDETIARIREKMLDDNDDEEKTTEIEDILSAVTENSSDNSQQQQKELLSTIDQDVQKANQHMRNLHTEIEGKTRRMKELDGLLNQEKDRCRELETKLKVVLELRERDAHLHIRQMGQTDAELRKARNDTERVRILQQQLELKQKQLDDVQKVLASEQTKFSEECSKLQHETHEKWMEVKRLTREVESARKECEGLRRQITKYANSERSSQEKMVHKPVPQHLNNTGRLSSEPETNGSSPPPLPYQQGDNFRPIDRERNDSGAASPAEMFRMRPSIFGLARPPFFPPPFMPPPPNPFMMPPRFPMSMGGPHGMISPIPHLMTNGSGGGSDTNSFEIVDSTNITPNSTSYDTQLNGSAASPTPDHEQQATAKPKKPKKSLKKKTKTSTTTTVSSTKEDV